MNKSNIKSLVSQVKKVQKGSKSGGNYICHYQGKVAMTYNGCYGMVFDLSLLEGTDIEIEENADTYYMLVEKLNDYVDSVDITYDFNKSMEENTIINDTVYQLNLNDTLIYYNKKHIDTMNRLAGRNKKVWIREKTDKISKIIFTGDTEFWGAVLPINAHRDKRS